MNTPTNSRGDLRGAFLETERFPSNFDVLFQETVENGRPTIAVFMAGKIIGDKLTDNSHTEDFFRYHDVFHLANAAILGWSPCARKLLGCKRKSNAVIDEVEDGGRASLIEEAVVSIIHKFVIKKVSLDDAITFIKVLVDGYEAQRFHRQDWEDAIRIGAMVFHHLVMNKGGVIRCDLASRSLQFIRQDEAAA